MKATNNENTSGSQTRKDMEEHLPSELVADYRDAFKMLDRSNLGVISLRDIGTVLLSINVHLSQRELRCVVDYVLDRDTLPCDVSFNKPCVIFSDFLAIMAAVATDCVSDEEVKLIFQQFDKDGDGFISQEELRALLSKLGDDVSENDLEEMMLVADQDGDGRVSFSEFIQVMTSQSPCHENKDHCDAAVFSEDQCLSCCGEEITSYPEENDSNSDTDTVEGIEITRRRKSSFEKRRKNFLEWFRGKQNSKSSTPKTSLTEDDIECSHPSCSSMEDIEPAENRQRRSSTIGRTLQLGRNALRATMKKTMKMK